MEHIKSLQFFTRTDKFNRLTYHGTNRQCRSTTSITIQLGQDHTIKVQTIVKFLRRVHGILSGHGIHHEKGLFRIDCFLDGSNFIHHLLVNSQTPRSIDNYDVFTCSPGLFHGIQGNFHRIVISFLAIHGNPDLLSQHF